MLLFGVNESFVSRELHHIIPIIYWYYEKDIVWPSSETRKELEGTLDIDKNAIASMDFTITPRKHSALNDEYYRGDKHQPFLNSFGVSDFRGIFLNFEPGFQGRAADQHSFVLTHLGKGDLQLEDNQRILADGGFSSRDDRIQTPYTYEDSVDIRRHKANRCSIETDFRTLKIMKAAAEKSRHSASFQALSIGAIARLRNHFIRKRLDNGIILYDILDAQVNTHKQ